MHIETECSKAEDAQAFIIMIIKQQISSFEIYEVE